MGHSLVNGTNNIAAAYRFPRRLHRRGMIIKGCAELNMIQLSNCPLTLSGSCEGVGVIEAVDDRVVIAALEVIPSRFCLMLVPARSKTEQFRSHILLLCEQLKRALEVQEQELFHIPKLKFFDALQEAGCPASLYRSGQSLNRRMIVWLLGGRESCILVSF